MAGYRWLWFGLLGAAFAAVVSVMTKKALSAADVFVALCLQSLLMLLTMVVAVTVMGRWSAARAMPRWAVGLVVLSGVAGGLSWTFGYQALQLASVSKVGPIDKLSTAMAVVLAVAFLRERPSPLNWGGIVLMIVGAYCVSHTAGPKH